MSVLSLLQSLTPEVTNLEEEYFSIFSEDIPSQSLGGVDPRAGSIDLQINGRDLTIYQSPTILNSSRAGGTTGAVVWKITPLFATWITSPHNPFLKNGLLSPKSAVLELGCGISAIIGLVVTPLVKSYTLTDQSYVSKLLLQNIEENKPTARKSTTTKSRKAMNKHKIDTTCPQGETHNLHFTTLDWETDEVSSLILRNENPNNLKSYDVLIACDCIYNSALITPLIQTMVDLCKLREVDEAYTEPTFVIVGQQRRSSEVFEDWLVEFSRAFRVWRMPDECLGEGLRSGSGYLVHVGILR